MKTFYYRTRRTMEPRPGVKYSTTYIKQESGEHERLLAWLAEIAENIIAASQQYPDHAEWFQRPMPDFKRSSRGEYYSPQDLLTDMIDQLVHGRDLTQAMLDRWNRLCYGTPWEIDLVPIGQATAVSQVRSELFV